MVIRKLLLLSVLMGILLIAMVDFSTAQETPEPDPVVATPTVDRLAPPPTMTSPSQADEGVQLYWLHCQPCHGDQGQGLTDDWRAQYPPEDQNCWESGCHGERPYEGGFTLPPSVPPVIGDGSLARFQTMGQVYHFVRATMPYQAAGSLTDEEYLAIVAFLSRAHGAWDGTSLDTINIDQVQLQVSSVEGGEEQPEASTTVEPDIHSENVNSENLNSSGKQPQFQHLPSSQVLLWGGICILVIVGGMWLWRWHRS